MKNQAILAEHPLILALVCFNVLMRPEETSELRKFVNLFIGADNDLFHNHQTYDKLHYRYPLVQYKSAGGKATLLGLTEKGTAALHSLLQHPQFRAQCIEWIGEQFAVTEEMTDTLLLHSSPRHSYRLQNYIALNEKNLLDWIQNPSLPARSALLERCIVGHILKFASAIKWLLPPRSLQVELLDFKFHNTRVFDNNFLAFEVLFRTNITLPEGIGLGKAVSHGFGVVLNDER